jgi:prolipoprotein diacylglyceryltransferase
MEHLSYLAFSGIIGGVLGARLAFALQPSEIHETLQHPIHLIAFWQPGLSLIGGIVLGFLAAGIYAWRAKLPIRSTFDVAAFGLGPAVAIGRIGCYLNGLHPGTPTSLPWGIYLDGAVRHPIPLYESILGVLIFGLAVLLFRRRLAPGVTALCLVIAYLVPRSALDMLRASGVDGPNVLVWGGFTLTQAASLIVVPLLALLAVWFVLKEKGPALGSAAKQ